MQQMTARRTTARAALLVAITLFTVTAAPAHAGPGSALSFNGVNNYVSATIPPLASNYTFSAWVYLRPGGNIGLLTGPNCGSSAEVLIFRLTANPADPQYVALGRCGSFNGMPSTTPVAYSQWFHLAVTVSSNKLVSYYLNGNAAGSWDANSYNGYNVTLGPDIHLGDNAVRHFNGMLDEVLLWSTARSQAEIQASLNQPPNVADPNLVAYWPFNEAAGTVTTADASGHGHTGTLVNRPAKALSPVGWTPQVQLFGANPLTNECHAAFTDPGAAANVYPTAIAPGVFHNLALRVDGAIVAWGRNGSSQTDVPAPATNVTAIAGGIEHSLALRADGAVVAWGGNSDGQLNVPATATNLIAIAAGFYHSLALRADGTVVAWGWNSDGQINVPAWATNVVGIAGGGYHSLGLKADGTVVAWGANSDGQLNVPATATNLIAIAAGRYHSLALRADGTVVAWGVNSNAQINVPTTARNVVAIAGGSYHSLALKADGTVITWGNNQFGQTNVPAAATNVIAIAAGGYHSLGLKADGTVVAWGGNGDGQLNIPASINLLPVSISGTVATNSPGTYLLAYGATNQTGAVLVTNRTVVVVDTTPPVLTLNGPDLLLVTNVNRAITDPGATANDVCGGSFAVATNSTVNVNFPGTYTITYAATDSYGNIGTTTRTVVVGLPPAVPGDRNGDGAVDQGELNTVAQHFWATTPPAMTGVTASSQGAFRFGLTNTVGLDFRVLASTNLTDWMLLSNTLPQLQFTDPDAAKYPQRFYRLRWP